MTSTFHTAPPSPRTLRSAIDGMPVLCPDLGCAQSAEVIATWVWSSTDGPVAHARTRCVGGHVFTPPADWLVPLDA